MDQIPIHKVSRLIHARERVEAVFLPGDLDRLIGRACANAEESSDWRMGQEFIFDIEEEPYSYSGITSSAFIICHMGGRYDIYYYDGLWGETYQ